MPIYSKTPLENLCDSINTAYNPKIPLTPNNVRVRKVTALNERSATKPNTTVTLTGRQSHGLVGDINVNVRRLDLQTLFKNQPPVLSVNRSMTMREASQLINANYGLNLDPNDFRADVYTGGTNFWLTPGSKSIQYTGRVLVKIIPMVRNLALLRARQLTVLKHPQDPDGRKCLDLLTYGWDCSTDQYAIRTTPAGVLTNNANNAALRQILKERGLGDIKLSGAQLTHFTNTSQVTTANKKYARVSTITGVDDPNYVGTIYLHYYL